MKKLFLLTSVLALTACGGGSGGGGAGGGGTVPLSDAGAVRAAFLTGAPSAANTELTSMTSAIVVRDDNSEPAVYRTPVARSYNGKDYTVYNLSDINFRIAEHPDAHFNFTVDDHGMITQISETLDGGTVDGVQRIGTTQRFNTPIFEYVKDKYAKVGEGEFSATKTGSDNTNLLAAIRVARSFGEVGNWEKNSGGQWQYKLGDETFAKVNGQTFVVDDNVDALLAEIKDANHFGDGNWSITTEGGVTTYKYVEYGDKTLKRVADTGQNMAALDAIAPAALGHWNRVDEILDISTEGEAVGLTFSDFGKFNPVYRSKHKVLDSTMLGKIRGTDGKAIDAALDGNAENIAALATAAGLPVSESNSHHDYKTAAERENEFNTSEDFQLFAGGYAIKDGALVDSLTPNNNTSYTGTAIGRVYVSIQSNGVDRDTYLAAWNVPKDDGDGWSMDAGHDMAKSYKTSQATMTIDGDGTQTLYMPFNSHSDTADTFYDVTIVKAGSDPLAVTFSDTANSLAESQYRMNNDPIAAKTESAFTPGYYGVETPSEAAGTARYYTEQELYKSGGAYVNREWEVQAAWGMKKD